MVLSVLLLLSVAMGSEEAAETLQGMGAERHPCVVRLPLLDAALQEAPTPTLRLQRALCLHAVGRYDQALTALDAAVPRGALTSDDQEEGATVQVVLLAWKGRTAAAGLALRALEKRLPSAHPRTTRARLLVQAGHGDVSGAWDAATQAWGAAPDEPQLVTALAELTALAPNDAPAWAREVLGRATRVLLQTNRAVGLLTAGDTEGCTRLVSETLPLATVEADRKRLHHLGHRCGAFGGDLAAANTHMIGLADLPALDDQAVLAHGDLLVQVGKTQNATRLLELAQVEDARGRDTRLLRWRLSLGDLKGAVEASEAGKASPESRATLGLALHKAGRGDEAVAILSAACPSLERRARADCEALSKRARAAARAGD
jgi:tetratricopeptide (TPR) repeat protein